MNIYRLSCYALRPATIAVALCASGIASAVDILDNGNQAQYQALANQAQFSMVGLLSINTGSATQLGTGTFIGFGNGKGWVITAEHVLDGYKAASSTFTVGGQSWTLGTTYSYLNDMAVIPLVGITAGQLTPAQFINSTLPISANLNQRFIGYTVGYGRSGTGSNPGTIASGTKRAFTNAIDAYYLNTYTSSGGINQSFNGYLSDFDDGTAANNTLDNVDDTKYKLAKTQTSARAPTMFEGSGDSGDSGGPLFVQIGTNWEMAGVYSSSVDGSGYGGWNLYQPIDVAGSQWITSKTGIAAVPEPISILPFAMGLGVLLRRKRFAQGS